MTDEARGRVPRPGRAAAAVDREDRGPRRVGTAGYCVASETCAFDLIGAELRARRRARRGRDADRSRDRVAEGDAGPSVTRSACSSTSTSRGPDSRMGGTVLQVARAKMGEILWREAPVDADVVIPVPDSGNAAARGLARAAGLPQDDGFIKNRYVARTFIQPGQELRRHGLRLKFNPLPEVVAGKRLVVVDDSIVRGNTMPADRADAARRRRRRDPRADLVAADQAPLPLRDRHVDARGDGRPQPHGRAGLRASSAPTRCTTCRSRASTRRSAATAATTATRASRGEYPLERSETAGGKFALERRCRSCAPERRV